MAERSVRILTLNTWKNDGDYFARMTAIVAALREMAPDIVVLQEAFRTLDGKTDTAATLARALELHEAFAPAREKSRLWAGTPAPSVSGLAILSRWAIENVERIELPTTAEGGERISLLAEIASPAGRIVAGCTHLAHLRGDGPIRGKQLAATLASPRWHLPAACRFLAGDFNAPPDAPELRSLPAHPTLDVADAWTLAGAPPARATCPLPPHPARASRCIDFIFSVAVRGEPHPRWTAASTALAAPLGGVYPSDHAAIVADASLAPSSRRSIVTLS